MEFDRDSMVCDNFYQIFGFPCRNGNPINQLFNNIIGT